MNIYLYVYPLRISECDKTLASRLVYAWEGSLLKKRNFRYIHRMLGTTSTVYNLETKPRYIHYKGT